ncbi:MAG: hypothetical protein J1F64_04710 [Oscillospiraceae bacterium]|nr:hypothetical protein [Oscillospiraceae bacterium]
MNIKCPECGTKELKVSKSPFKKVSLLKILVVVAILVGIWNLIASLKGGFTYTCTACGERFK